MRTLLKTTLPLLSLLVLTACGGGDPATPAQQPRQLSAIRQGDTARTAADYTTIVEQLYISYFGRPADAGGLANFAAQMVTLNAPTDIRQLNSAYSSDVNIRGLIDTFGNSTESQALYSGDNETFVKAIYQNVLGRPPLDPGLQFWKGALDSGTMTRANASLQIMGGALANTSAQGQQDAQLIANRVAVGTTFTAHLDTDAEKSAYSGKTAAASARSMLAAVNAGTDPVAYQATVDSTIAALVTAASGPSFSAVRSIINARCISCHGGQFPTLGIHLDDDAVVHSIANDIYIQVVVQRTMPQFNSTGMTDAERDTIKAWFLAGAK